MATVDVVHMDHPTYSMSEISSVYLDLPGCKKHLDALATDPPRASCDFRILRSYDTMPHNVTALYACQKMYCVDVREGANVGRLGVFIQRHVGHFRQRPIGTGAVPPSPRQTCAPRKLQNQTRWRGSYILLKWMQVPVAQRVRMNQFSMLEYQATVIPRPEIRTRLDH